jgi:hypothetical protein
MNTETIVLALPSHHRHINILYIAYFVTVVKAESL